MEVQISIIVPVYNCESTLKKCVDSIMNKQRKKIEIILVDDHSKDGSWDLCNYISDMYSEVRCVRNPENKGVSFTRNHGLKLARGKYILFVDSDDCVTNQYINMLVNIQNHYPNDFIICGYHYSDYINHIERDYLWDNSNEEVVALQTEQLFILREKHLLQQVWNKIFRRDIITNYGLNFDESQSMGEDFQFVLNYLEVLDCKKYMIINKPLYNYIYASNTSLMSKFGLTQTEEAFQRLDQLKRICGNNNAVEDQYEDAIEKLKANFVYHIVRSRLKKSVKLTQIESIMKDHQAQNYYMKERMRQIKENVTKLIRF